MHIGESFVGAGPNAAHINTVLGHRDGPAGTAWATALATPTQGHAPFMVVLRPNLPVKPLTLFVNKATITDDEHGELTWGPAQAGVAAGVADAVAEGVIPVEWADSLVLITAVWVNPQADAPDEVYRNNRKATREALAIGAWGGPTVDAVLAASTRPTNPFFNAPE
ncbi:formaldehyde-activating enzyme [Streptomyces sp. NPDC048479]|uniref:formaldehyde-activating enzyme n=1 Tax=Streptomyces sp. NPDC048479 TaxID=3154725 RepID=UPI0034180558